MAITGMGKAMFKRESYNYRVYIYFTFNICYKLNQIQLNLINYKIY